MTDYTNSAEPAEGPACLTSGCKGHMVDVQPIEVAHSGQFILIRIECPECHARAWRIERSSES